MGTLDQLEARQRQLKTQIQRKKRAMAAEGRKARNHALMVIGGLVVQHAPDGDWKQIDMDALAAWIDRYGYKISRRPPRNRRAEWRGRGRLSGQSQPRDAAARDPGTNGASGAPRDPGPLMSKRHRLTARLT